MSAETATIDTTAPGGKQSVWMRIFWFGVGAGVSYLLISTPLDYLTRHHPEWPGALTSALSVGVGSTFFFFWNYFVNFRTGSSKRDALARYIVAVALLWALQSLALWLFKSIDKHPFVHLLALKINRDVVATQFSLGGFKFLIYHFWAFPASSGRSMEASQAPGATMPRRSPVHKEK